MYRVIIQQAAIDALAPKPATLRKWAKKVLQEKVKTAELTIRLVTVAEMQKLNEQYRYKKGPTNVLSFPLSLPEAVQLAIPILGDVVLCSEIINEEAKIQEKTPESHWAHMVVHGLCHLLGYDHEAEKDALKMQAVEIDLLYLLGFGNPYE